MSDTLTRAQVLSMAAFMGKEINDALADPRSQTPPDAQPVDLTDRFLQFVAFDVGNALLQSKQDRAEARECAKRLLADMDRSLIFDRLVWRSLTPHGLADLMEAAQDDDSGRQSYHAAAIEIAGLFRYLKIPLSERGYYSNAIAMCLKACGQPIEYARPAARYVIKRKDSLPDPMAWHDHIERHRKNDVA